jgi:hypothetical protein
MNSKRQENQSLYTDYVITEDDCERILLSLQPEDFSKAVNNEHLHHQDERLYIFGKKVSLLERFGSDEKEVMLYIKINKLAKRYVIIVLFHEEKYTMKYPLK